MARQATGQVIVRKGKRGTTYAVRFRAYGKREYLTLGTAADGWTRKGAEAELANVMADVRRGIWRPSAIEAEPAPQAEPDFHSFATDWFERRKLDGLRPRTLEHLEWVLSYHLLPHFHALKLGEITPQAIDRYTAAKVKEGRLANATINKTVTVLGSVLELALEYGLIASNPAVGRRRKLQTTKTTRPFLEPAQIGVLLAAAGALDAEDRTGRRYRRPLLATLAYAGLRIGELLALRWQDIDLAGGSIAVREAKTAAGVRSVDIQPELRDELAIWKASTSFGDRDDLAFPTGTGRPNSRGNIRKRVLLRAVERANQELAAASEDERLPEDLSPHALRRSFASMLAADGDDIRYTMDQLGHADPKVTLGIYAQVLKSKRRRADQRLASCPTMPVSSPPAPAARRHRQVSTTP